MNIPIWTLILVIYFSINVGTICALVAVRLDEDCWWAPDKAERLALAACALLPIGLVQACACILTRIELALKMRRAKV